MSALRSHWRSGYNVESSWMTTLRDLVLRVEDGSVIEAVAQLPTREGPKAKPYQVKQVRKILAKYKLL